MKRAAIVTLATVLAGCAVGPDYSRPSTPMPGEFASPDVAAASKLVLPEQWWTLYGDATLDKLVAEALARNADVQVAVARVNEAEANLREAGAYLYPEFDAGLNGSRSRVSASTALPNPSPLVRNDVRLALGTAFELDFWGRLRRGQEAAGALAISSRYGRDVVRISIAGLVAQAYFTVRSLDAQLRLAASTYDARKDSLDVAASRVKAGLASDLDVNQARIALADASLQIKELTRQRELTEHQLGTFVGRLDLKIAPEAIALPGLPAIPSAGLPSELLERRPDVRQAEQLLVAANAQIGFAKAAYFPTITLAASYGGESATLASTIKSAASIWSVGAGAVMPLLDWGKTTRACRRGHRSYRCGARDLSQILRDRVPGSFGCAHGSSPVQLRAAGARGALEDRAGHAGPRERALPVRLFGLPRGARRATHRQRRAARRRAQQAGAPGGEREPDEGVGRRLAGGLEPQPPSQALQAACSAASGLALNTGTSIAFSVTGR